MKKEWSFPLLVLLLLISARLYPQKPFPAGYFRSPIDFPIQLAGSFGDIRPNHLHSGIDIRTESVTGKPVYAAADGYVSRIFISPTGFGKALYITHPNGYTTVYGHLQGFNKAIRSWIRSRQYSRESFEIDTPVDPGTLPVKKGEIIAWSGNTGASGGPHLHFEIRDSPTQDAINPVLFGLPVKDVLPPVIGRIRIYPFDEMAMINFANAPLTLRAEGKDGSFELRVKDTVRVSGNIYFGIEALDPSDAANIKSGIRSITLYVDTAEYFSQTLTRFAFSATRYVNTLVDYPLLVREDEKIQRSYLSPNNRLGIYDRVQNRGIVNFSDQEVHRIRYVVKDALGNTSTIAFMVRSHLPAGGRHPLDKAVHGKLFSWNMENHFTAAGCRLDLPEEALYEDLDFNYSCSDSVPAHYFSRIHTLHDELTPLQKPCTLSLQAERLPASLRAKAVIVRIGDNGRPESMGGDWKDDYVTASIHQFGRYAILIDTVAPVIRPVNIYPGKNVGRQNTIRMRISDDLSGIRSYRGTINGKWILMDFDAKTGILEYEFDDRIQAGKNDFRLTVKDAAGNHSDYHATLTR